MDSLIFLGRKLVSWYTCLLVNSALGLRDEGDIEVDKIFNPELRRSGEMVIYNNSDHVGEILKTTMVLGSSFMRGFFPAPLSALRVSSTSGMLQQLQGLSHRV